MNQPVALSLSGRWISGNANSTGRATAGEYLLNNPTRAINLAGVIVSTETAREAAAKLIELADYYDKQIEEAKPKVTRQKFVQDLPAGTVFETNYLDMGVQKHIRLAGDKIFNVKRGQSETVGFFTNYDTDVSDIKVIE